MGASGGFIICAGFLGFFGLFFGTRALTRWFQHRERMALIAHGLLPNDVVKDDTKKRNGKGTLAWGVAITAFGLALMCGLLPLVFSRPGGSYDGSELFLLPGLIVAFMGIALVIIYFVTRRETRGEDLSPAELDEVASLAVPELEVEEE